MSHDALLVTNKLCALVLQHAQIAKGHRLVQCLDVSKSLSVRHSRSLHSIKQCYDLAVSVAVEVSGKGCFDQEAVSGADRAAQGGAMVFEEIQLQPCCVPA